MKVFETPIPDLKVIEPQAFSDRRGVFFETWNARSFAEAGIADAFVQDNQSSSHFGVLRGLHYQLRHPQGKVVRVTAGRAFDVAVDMRRSSPAFGRWFGVELNAVDRRMLWVPPGFAHGFLALEEGTEVMYKCTDYYAPEDERAVLWCDPNIGIEWPLPAGGAPIISQKDASAGPFAEADTFE